MAPTPKPQRARRKHYFREWRKSTGLTQEQALEHLGWSQSKISRIESGVTPYNQDDLEFAAEVYGCTPTDLLNVNPLKEHEVVDLLRIFRRSPENARRAAIRMLEELTPSTPDSRDGFRVRPESDKGARSGFLAPDDDDFDNVGVNEKEESSHVVRK